MSKVICEICGTTYQDTAETSAATAAIRDRSDMRGTECKERTEKNGII